MKKIIIRLLLLAAAVSVLMTCAVQAAAGEKTVIEIKLAATVSEYFSIEFTYDQFGLNPRGLSASCTDSSRNTLSEYGLIDGYRNDYVRFEGTPTKTGTATYRLDVVSGGQEYALDFFFAVTDFGAGSDAAAFRMELEEGMSFGSGCAFSDYFSGSSFRARIDPLTNTLPEYGLWAEISETGVNFGGSPTKPGVACCRVEVTGETIGCLDIRLYIKPDENETRYILWDDSGAVGVPFDETYLYSEMGVPSGFDGVLYDESSNLADYGLDYELLTNAIRIFGKPAQSGTAIASLVFTRDDAPGFLAIEITLGGETPTVEGVTKKYDMNLEVGSPFRVHTGYQDCGIAGPYTEILASLNGNLEDYGIELLYDEDSFTLSGTPVKAGEPSLIFQINNADSLNRIELRLHITAPAGGPVITRQPVPVIARDGGTVSFEAAAEGTNLTYKWYILLKNQGDPVLFGIGQKAEFGPVSTSVHNGSVVYCVVSDGRNFMNSEKALLTVTDADASASDYLFPFLDVFPTDWFYSDVYTANRMGLINGKTETLYKPNDNMTYAEAVKLAACMNQLYTTGSITLKNGALHWYDPYYEYCGNAGIIQETMNASEPGLDQLYERANDTITREMYVYLFSRSMPKESFPAVNRIADNAIPDVPVSQGAMDDGVYLFYRAGILTGSDEKGTFRPQNNIRRSEVAAILNRMMDSAARKNLTLD